MEDYLVTNTMETSFEEMKRLEKAKKRARALRDFYRHLAVYIVANFASISIIWLNLQDGEEFFTFCTFSIAFFWGISLAFHAVGVFGTSFSLGKDWERKKILELMQKEQQRKQTR